MPRTQQTARKAKQAKLASAASAASTLKQASVIETTAAEKGVAPSGLSEPEADPQPAESSETKPFDQSRKASEPGSLQRSRMPPLVDLTDDATAETSIPEPEVTARKLQHPEQAPFHVQGVLIASRSPEEVGQPDSTDHFAALGTVQIPSHLAARLPWEISPTSAVVGLPLKITWWPSDNSKQTNNITLGLLMDPDPESDDFGRVKYKRMDGTMVVARTDGKDVSKDEVKALLFYLGSVASTIQSLVKAGYETAEDRVANAKAFVETKLTAAALQNYAETLAQAKSTTA